MNESRRSFRWVILFLTMTFLIHSPRALALVMSNGIYSVRSDIFDSGSKQGESSLTGGIYKVFQSMGQSSVASSIGTAIPKTTNFSGNVPELSGTLSTLPGALLLDDFENGLLTDLNGGNWIAENDTSIGGNSVCHRKQTNLSAQGDKALFFQYALGSGSPFPYAALSTSYPNNIDYSQNSNIVLTIKGNGYPLKLIIRTGNISDGDYYRKSLPATLTNWTSYTLRFSSFSQEGWGIPQPFRLDQTRGFSISTSSLTAGENGWFIIDNIQVGPVFPQTVAGLTAAPVSSNTIKLDWNQSPYALSYRVFFSTTSNTNTSTQVATLPSSQRTLTHHDPVMTPNSRYSYWVACSNLRGWGPRSARISRTTYAGRPDVNADRPVDVTFTNNPFIFWNSKISGFAGYAHAWIRDPSYVPTMSDTIWADPTNSASLNRTCADEGKYFLHVRTYNDENIPFYTQTLGPFLYFKQYVQDFDVKISTPRIMNNGQEEALIMNVAPLMDTNSKAPLTSKKFFLCEAVSGNCLISGFSNVFHPNKATMTNSGSSITFKIRGDQVQFVTLRISWVEDPDVGGNIDLLISPPMDIAEEKDSVIYRNVVNPEAGDALDLYVNTVDGEQVKVTIYDIQAKRVVYEEDASGRYLLHIRYDLKTRRGVYLPDGIYGVLIRGKDWKKELKFIVSRKRF